MNANIAELAEMRSRMGDDFWLMWDCWMSLDLDYATRLALRSHELGLKWIEERLIPDDYWTNPEGVALRWVMSATVTNPKMFGEQAVGKRWRSEGMSWLVIHDGKVSHEVDYHDSGAVAKSLKD